MTMNEKNGKSETALEGAAKLALAGFLYVLFHLRLGGGLAETARATLGQMLLTAPYALGFTLLLLYAHRRLGKGPDRPPRPGWTRVARIFLTMGICFGLFFALFEYGGGAPHDPSSAGGFWGDAFRKLRSR